MKDPFHIRAGWLIDGTGGPARRDEVLEIGQGRIASVRKGRSHHPETVRTLDFTRHTVIPGLVDCHVHLFMSGTGDPSVRQRQRVAPYDDLTGLMERHLRAHLNRGIAAVRDGGDHGGYALRYKGERSDRHGPIPYLQAAGRAWHAPDRYGRLIGRPPLKGLSLARSILLDHDRGDHIKIVNSGLNSLSTFGMETRPQFGLDEMKEAVAVGLGLGLRTMVHANGRAPVEIAVRAGCGSVEHGFFMGEDNLAGMADRGMVWVPTIFTMKAYAGMLGAGTREQDISQRNLDHQLDQVRRALDLGVPIAVGTDSGSLGVHHGEAVREEIGLLLAAGWPIEKAVRCATAEGAQLLGLQEQVGKLTPGMPATFLVLQGGPDNVVKALRVPEKIFIQGKDALSMEPRQDVTFQRGSSTM